MRVVSVERCPQKGSAAPGENVPHAQRGTQRVFYKEPGNSERVTAVAGTALCEPVGARVPVLRSVSHGAPCVTGTARCAAGAPPAAGAPGALLGTAVTAGTAPSPAGHSPEPGGAEPCGAEPRRG